MIIKGQRMRIMQKAHCAKQLMLFFFLVGWENLRMYYVSHEGINFFLISI